MSVAFSPDGVTGATSSGSSVQLWDVATGRPLGPPILHALSVTALVFSPDGRTLTTASYDRTARICAVPGGKPLGPPVLHDGGVGALAISPDGRTLLTGSWDHTARLTPLPAAVPGTPDAVVLWAQVLTGMELDDDGAIRMLDEPTWQKRRQRLTALGEPPLP
jgi:hypothetical protein